jgi:hypothetical protein
LRGNPSSRRLLSRLLRSPPPRSRSSGPTTAAVHQVSVAGAGLDAGEGHTGSSNTADIEGIDHHDPIMESPSSDSNESDDDTPDFL